MAGPYTRLVEGQSADDGDQAIVTVVNDVEAGLEDAEAALATKAASSHTHSGTYDPAGSAATAQAAAIQRANHTGTQTASTISDFNTAVRTNRLDQMAAPTAAVEMGSQRVTGLATPSASTDAATKGYADSVAGSLYGYYSVRAYGATGDGSTDATSSINSAIAALNSAGRGVLYFPPGTYKVTAGLTAITVKATVRGDGGDGMWMNGGVSTINCTSATANLLTISQHGCTVRDLSLRNTASSTPSAGSGIRVTKGDALRLIDVGIRGFYDNVNMTDGGEWFMDRCHFYGMVRYGLYLSHVDLGDSGDGNISNSFFISDKYDNPTGIYHVSGGGLKITSCKFNGRPAAGTYGDESYAGPATTLAYGYDSLIDQSTSILIIGDSSFENFTSAAVRVRPTGGSQYPYIMLSNIQVAPHNAANGIIIDGSGGVIDMVHLTNIAMSGPNSGTAITLNTIGVACKLTSVSFRQWSTNVSQTSVTGYSLV